MEIPIQHLSFKHPSSCVIAGPSKSGKTNFVISVLNNHDYFFPSLNTPRVGWLSGTPIDHSQFDKSLKVKNISELPKSYKDLDILVIDDLLQELGQSKKLVNVFTKVSHHERVSVFFLSQKFFYKSAEMNIITGNADYIVLLKNARDQSSFFNLARQLEPTNPKALLEVFRDATSEPYSSIRIDNTASCPPQFRFLTGLAPLKPFAYINEEVKGTLS